VATGLASDGAGDAVRMESLFSTNGATTAEERIAARNIVAALQRVVERSRTYRALVNHALATRQRRAPRVEVQVRPLARPICSGDGRVVRVPPIEELSAVSYADVTGTTPFQPVRVWVHESIHAMTGLLDVDAAQRMLHRGPVVYLTDLILFEADYQLPERIVYQRPIDRLPGVNAEIDDARARCRLALAAEDDYLDQMMQRWRHDGAPDDVLGTPVAQRATVTQFNAMDAEIRAARDTRPLPRRDFHERMRPLWQIAAGADFSTSFEQAGQFMHDIDFLYRHDEMFRYLCETWFNANHDHEWLLSFTEHPREAPASACPWTIDREARTLTIHEDPVFYLAKSGPRLVESRRRHVGALVDLVMRWSVEPLNANDAGLNRGLRAYLENRLLSHFGVPERLSAQFDFQAERFWPWVVKARRAADAEDAFLRTQRTTRRRSRLGG
jgi:hypothetical protein